MRFRIQSNKDLTEFKKKLSIELDILNDGKWSTGRAFACHSNYKIGLVDLVLKNIRNKERMIVNASPIDIDELRRQMWHNNNGVIIVCNPSLCRDRDDFYSILKAVNKDCHIQCPSTGKYAIYDPSNYYGNDNKKILKCFNERIAGKKKPELYYPNRFYFNGLLIFVGECHYIEESFNYPWLDADVCSEYAEKRGFRRFDL